MSKIIIVGGGIAGCSTAIMARRFDYDAAIKIISDEKNIGYSRCGMPLYLSGKLSSIDKIKVYDEKLLRGLDIDVVKETKVTKIKPSKKEVTTNDDKSSRIFHYDFLVVATGSSPIDPPFASSNRTGIFSLYKLEDCLTIKEKLEDTESVAITGGRLLGVELASALSSTGKSITLITRSGILRGLLDKEMADIIRNRIVQSGIKLILNKRVKMIDGDSKVEGITYDGGKIPADMVILAIGVKPNVRLAERSGLQIGITGGISTNLYLQTSIKNIYAAGDCTEVDNFITGKPVSPAKCSVAYKHGNIVGQNVTGARLKYTGELLPYVTSAFGLEVGGIGLTETQAREEGIDIVSATVEGKTKAEYHPDAGIIEVKLIFERKTGRLIGSQIVGEEGVALRINMLSMAIMKQLTASQIVDLDTCFDPSLISAVEPIVEAAWYAQRKLTNNFYLK